MCQISFRSVYSVAPWQRETQNVCHLWIRHFVTSPVGSNLRKLKTRAQLQTFPCPMASKSFLCSNAFVAKLGAQSLTFNSVTDRQTDKQKTHRFWPPQRRVKSDPHQTWHGDRGPRAGSCTSKTFGSPTHSFAARGAKNLGEPDSST